MEKGKHHSEETKMKLAKSSKGNKNWLGKHHSEETKRKISNAKLGSHLSEDHKRKIGKGNRGNVLSEEAKRRIGEAHKGTPLSEEHKRKLSDVHSGKKHPHSTEQRRKVRIALIKNWKRKDPEAHSNYNPTSIPFFDEVDRVLNTKGYYGSNEFLIKELGYFPDYINFEKKLIIEWDEEKGHYRNGKLREKDEVRQQEIQAFYPDFRFCRIRESYL